MFHIKLTPGSLTLGLILRSDTFRKSIPQYLCLFWVKVTVFGIKLPLFWHKVTAYESYRFEKSYRLFSSIKLPFLVHSYRFNEIKN